MSNYFKNFPKIDYMGSNVVDITRRVKIIEDLRNNPYAFLPYTIKDDDRPEDIALYYYNDPGKVWLVYLANNIIDPYTQWPMSNENFEKTLMVKYETANRTGYEVLEWAMNTNITSNILYYKNYEDDDIEISVDTYNLDPTLDTSKWYPVRVYDHEMMLNENRRTIFLVNSVYADQLQRDLKVALNGN